MIPADLQALREFQATLRERFRQADAGETEPLDIEAIKRELIGEFADPSQSEQDNAPRRSDH